jgi:hypothetical protein
MAVMAWAKVRVVLGVMAGCLTRISHSNTVNKWGLHCIKAFRYKFGVGGFI